MPAAREDIHVNGVGGDTVLPKMGKGSANCFGGGGLGFPGVGLRCSRVQGLGVCGYGGFRAEAARVSGRRGRRASGCNPLGVGGCGLRGGAFSKLGYLLQGFIG